MAAEVLRPQDCLVERIGVLPAAAISRRRTPSCYNGNASSSCNYYYYCYNYCNAGYGRNNCANPNANARSSRRAPEQRRAAPASRRSASADDLRAARTPEKVTILRRGESLDSKIKSEALKRKEGSGWGGGLAVCGAQRLGPDPEMVPRRLGIVAPATGSSDVYAGSAFAVSPAPSSLPLPSFSKKKQAPIAAAVAVDDSATRDLRRLLRID